MKTSIRSSGKQQMRDFFCLPVSGKHFLKTRHRKPFSLPQTISSLNSVCDPQYNLRLVGHAGGRFAGGLEGDELCFGAGAPSRNDIGRFSIGIQPAIHEFLRSSHTGGSHGAAGIVVSQPLPRDPGFRLRASLCAPVSGILPRAEIADVSIEHDPAGPFRRAMPRDRF